MAHFPFWFVVLGIVGAAIAGQARFAKPLSKAKLYHCSAKIVSQITAMTHVAE
jgi:hypothetical protein